MSSNSQNSNEILKNQKCKQKPPKVSLKQVYVEPFNFYKPYLTAIIIEIIHVHSKDSNSTIFVFNDIVCLFFDKLDIIITDPLISFCGISSFHSLKGPGPIIFFNCNKVKRYQDNDRIKRQKMSRMDFVAKLVISKKLFSLIATW